MTASTDDCSVSQLVAPADRARRVLLIAYNFPPVGGAGVQRPAKWAKYLRRFGWDVTVLTTENPSVPVRDESLLADLPEDVRIVRARTWEPDYRVKQSLVGADSERPSLMRRIKAGVKGLARRCVKLALQPDPQVLWNPNALRAGAAVLREQPHDAILVTAPAFSSFLVGAALKRQFDLPLILDYRDEWDLSGRYLENAQRDWYSSTVQNRMQRRLLRQADAVVATTRASTTNLANKLAALGHFVPAVCIYNGFDAEDFEDGSKGEGRSHTPLARPSKRRCPGIGAGAGGEGEGTLLPSIPLQSPLTPNPSPQRGEGDKNADTLRRDVRPSTFIIQPSTSFRLVYTGTLWNLTDIEPLVKAIESLSASRPELLRRLELVCVGRKTAEQHQVLERVRATTAHLEAIDYCDHSQVLDRLNSADGVCLLLSDVPGAERVVPAKLFEYLAVRKEILTIAPHGETADIARRFFPQGHFVPNDTAGIATWLQNRLSDRSDSHDGQPSNRGIDEFSRQSQTERLAQLLNELVAHR